MSASIKINFQSRKPGAKFAKEARQKGLIPVVLYGLHKKNAYYNLNKSEFDKLIFSHETALFNVHTEEEKDFNAIIKDQVYDTLKNQYLHLDFMRVDSRELIEVMVPLKFIGDPIGVKSPGGLLNKVLDTVKIECLPNFIPSEIEVDIAQLKLDEKIMVKDLVLPNDVKLISDKDLTVAVIHINPIEDETKPEEETTGDLKTINLS